MHFKNYNLYINALNCKTVHDSIKSVICNVNIIFNF